MPPQKRNQYLDDGDSGDNASQGYHSEPDKLQKGGRSAKRRKTEDYRDEDDWSSISDGEDDREEEGNPDEASEKPPISSVGDENDNAISDKTEISPAQSLKQQKAKRLLELPGSTKPLTKKNLVATEAAIKKSGVVYLSRIPPFMKPQKLRGLLSPYGTINRIFLSPEDPVAHARRVRNGGNKKRMFTEGWVEFVRKGDAKRACELLNARTIGGKKGTFFRDDVWSMRYLHGFRWHNLTEQIAAENAERTSRMRAEISKTTKENKEFIRNVERAKMLDGMQSKAAAKKKKGEDAAGDEQGRKQQVQERSRSFRQIPLAKKRPEREEQPEQVARVLNKIF